MLVLPNLRQKPLYQIQTAVSRLEYILLVYWKIHCGLNKKPTGGLMPKPAGKLKI
jgi:hypothetical protein